MSVGLEPGTTFAGYRVESLIGRGGMGVVFRATDESLERPVALKLIATEYAEDEQFRRRFLRESRLAASLDHPNVVPVYEAREHEGRLYLAMRYVEGSDLRTLLRGDAKPEPERSVAILRQIASALDTAHRRALVHRDVKPGNVLVDENGHAYLTDFGVSKRLGGESTDTGQLVGTLDYLAPEQIRGEDVSGRADQYALACMLYECFAGAPPFHRETEAQTLWAHMQEEVPSLPGRPALDAVLRKGLAKAPGDRYGSCAELIAEAERALGRARVSAALLRRRRWILGAGLAVLGAAVAAAVVTVTGGGEAGGPPVGNGVVAVGAADTGIASFTKADIAPSNVAVGEGAIWVVNGEAETVSKIDLKTRKVVRTFRAGRRPTGIAAGAGALWVATGGGEGYTATKAIARVDPRTARITRKVKLPLGGWPNNGLPEIAVGAGAVWVVNSTDKAFRIEPDTGKVVARIAAPASRTIAVGDEGVWYSGWDNWVRRIDPQTNRVVQRIRVGSQLLTAIAVGAGSVWATSDEGSLWRIEPGRRPPIMRTIDVGFGAAYVAFGDGAVWVANYIDGTVARIDPRTNAVTATVPVGAAQALAAGAGSAWASVAGATPDRTLPASACDAPASGGRTPDVLIASDLALQGPFGANQRTMADAIRFVLKRHDFRAGRYTVGYQSCDDSTAVAGQFEQRRCAANAHAYARAERLVAVIGPDRSFCAQVQIPIANEAAGGPLALVGPSSSFPSLTRGGRLVLPPPYGRSGEPEVYYPTGARNFFRTIARQDVQAPALALLAKQRRLRGVYLIHDAPDGIGKVVWADPFRRAAARLGVRVVGSASHQVDQGTQALVDRVARSGADGVLLGTVTDGGLVKALRERLGPGATIMGGDGFADIPGVVDAAGRAARGLYMTPDGVAPEALAGSPVGDRFLRDFGGSARAGYAAHAAQATDVVLRAIERSDGTRESVLEQLRRTSIKDGLLGTFRFDRNGDMTPARIAILRLTGRSSDEIGEGAVVDRVVSVPASLSG